jgi:hypothetical protein
MVHPVSRHAEALVTDDAPPDHLPDPEQCFQVLAYTRGAEAYIKILDDVRKTGVMMDLLSALRAAAEINLEATRIMEVVASQIEQGTMPVWRTFISDWGPHGNGTAEQN